MDYNLTAYKQPAYKQTGYKILGFLVWKGGNIYLRRRYPGAARKVAFGGIALFVLAIGITGGVAAQRRSATEEPVE